MLNLKTVSILSIVLLFDYPFLQISLYCIFRYIIIKVLLTKPYKDNLLNFKEIISEISIGINSTIFIVYCFSIFPDV